jgi:hypothetical protein
VSDDGQPAPAVVGVADHSGWANLVTVAVRPDGVPVLVDRRRCDLVGPEVARQPYHAAAGLDAQAAEALVEEVTAAAEAGARAALAALAADLTPAHTVAAVTLRTTGGRPLPDTVAEVLASHSAMHAAEGELYREAWATAAEAMGIAVTHHRRPPKGATPSDPATEAAVATLGREAGPPWRAEHREAATAALTTLDDLDEP